MDALLIFPVTQGGALVYPDRLRRYAQGETARRSRILGSTPMYQGDIRNILGKVIRASHEDSLIRAFRTLESDIESSHLLP